MQISKIKTQKPFKDLFRIYDDDYKEVLDDIKQNGYDPNEPVLIWKEKDLLIDGHTRLQATKEAGLKDIPTSLLVFDNENDALKYAIKRNKNKGRRVTTGDKFMLFEVVDEIGEEGGDKKSKNHSKNFCSDPASAKHTAKLIGASDTQVTKMRTILQFADEEDIEQVRNDEISIDAAWKKAKEVKQKIEDELKKETKFNKTNDSVEWAQWTWNPVTGCEHGCKYCYARDIANRFYKEKFKPTFHEKRLNAPKNTKVPDNATTKERNVFCVSMGDLFGGWVPEEWIDQVLKSIENNPQWNFLILTKNPKRYLDFKFPKNTWLGTTIDTQSRVKEATKVFKKLKATVKFFSCEPLQEELTFESLKMIDWLIIGGRTKSTGMKEGQPEWEWVEKLLFKAREGNVKIYFKPNMEIRPKEYPELEEK